MPQTQIEAELVHALEEASFVTLLLAYACGTDNEADNKARESFVRMTLAWDKLIKKAREGSEK
jgi:hypothetical protein